MKQIYFMLFCLFFGQIAQAQTAEIKGQVVDEADSQGMVGVSVRHKESRLGTITDLDGGFTLKNLPIGKATLVFSFIGYDELSLEVEVVEGENAALQIKLKANEVGLKEVEVFANMTEDRKTPVAVSGLDYNTITEQFVGMELPEMLNTFAGVYSTQGAGGFGDNDVFIRGFPQTEIAFMVNGIPVNDMENGRMFWSNFAGISEVTRRMEVQRGLGATKLAVSSIGGTVNMITKPSERRKGGRIDYSLSNGAWNNRLRFTLNTGEMKGGWAISVQGSRTTTTAPFGGMLGHQFGGYRPGAFVDAWSYYIALNKKINSKHSLMFTAFGAPVNRGTAWNTSNENYKRFGNYHFNWAAGYYRGDFFNARQNYAHKPQISLAHYWNLSSKTQLTTSVYASYARVYSTQPRGSFSSSNLAQRDGDGYIRWDDLAAANRASTVTVDNPNGDPLAGPITGYGAKTWIEARHNNHDWYGIISNLNIDLTSKLNLVTGIDLRTYRADHYATVFELFGADFLVDKFTSNSTSLDNNMLRPNNVAYHGDRINYDYSGNVRWAALFAQAEYSLSDKFSLFATVVGSQTNMFRVGNFWNQNVPQNSLGKSDVKTFNNYNLKAGGTYRIDGRNSVYVNVGNFTRAPYLATAYVDSRYRNDYLQNLKSEGITAFELGYAYRMSRLKFNVNLYQIEWQNRVVNGDLTANDFRFTDSNGTELFYTIQGQNAVHQGIEADFTANLTNAFELKGMINLGDWKWKNNAEATVINDNGQILAKSSFYADGLPIGNTAQTTAFIGIHYKGIKDTYVGGRLMYFDRLYVAYTPGERKSPTQEKPKQMPSYSQVALYGGHYFKLGGDIRARVSFNINNLFNTRAASFASVFQGETQYGYIFGRTFNLNLAIDF
jgi:outer membrane cobalamin receptor